MADKISLTKHLEALVGRLKSAMDRDSRSLESETAAREAADTALGKRIDEEASARAEAVGAAQAAARSYADEKTAAADAALKAHRENTSNPHGVTKAQVELGNVDNTSDADKPVSTRQQAAITAAREAAEAHADTKAAEVSGALTDHMNDDQNPHGVTPEQISAIPTSQKGEKLGVAPLDGSGKISPDYLPGFVSDVFEYPDRESFPPTGETNKIYIDASTGQEYRWSGSMYAEISKDTNTTYRLTKSGSTIKLTGSDGSETAVTDADTVYTHPGHTAHDNGFYKVTVDGEGHVSEAKSVTKEDITKLGIPDTDTVYTHPKHTAHDSGLYKVTVDGEGHVTEAAEVVKADITGLGIASDDDATVGAHGLMSAVDKAKLDGIEEGATKTTVDSALDNASTNPVENKAVAAKFPIQTGDIANDAVTQDKLAEKSVGNAQIQLGSITGGKIKDGEITGGKLADKTVTGAKIAERTVTLSNIAPGSEANRVLVTVYEDNKYQTHWRQIDSSMIMDKQVQNADIADATIVGSEKLKAKSVTGGRIADKTVGTDQLADKCINADKIQAGSVTQPKIQDKAVTEGKLSSDVAAKLHTHDNKTVLDGITQSVVTNSHTHSNRAALDTIKMDSDNAFAAGEGAAYSGPYSTAIGGKASAGDSSVALGSNAVSGNMGSVAIGSSAQSNDGGVAIGDEAYARYASVAIGDGAKATGTYTTTMQLGQGTNEDETSTAKIWNYTLLSSSGKGWDSPHWLTDVGQLTNLKTSAKTTVVAAINELAANKGAVYGGMGTPTELPLLQAVMAGWPLKKGWFYAASKDGKLAYLENREAKAGNLIICKKDVPSSTDSASLLNTASLFDQYFDVVPSGGSPAMRAFPTPSNVRSVGGNTMTEVRFSWTVAALNAVGITVESLKNVRVSEIAVNASAGSTTLYPYSWGFEYSVSSGTKPAPDGFFVSVAGNLSTDYINTAKAATTVSVWTQ